MADTALARRPPSADALGKGGAIALGVHVVLVVALSLGVNWRTTDRAGVEAELWAAVPQVAALPGRSAPPEPRPAPPPEPKPEVKPEPRPEPPKPAPKAEPKDADIAIKKEPKAEPKPPKEEPKVDKAAEERKKAEAKKAEEALKAAQAKAEEESREKLREEQLRRMTAQLGGDKEGGSEKGQKGGTAAQTAGPSADYRGRVIARIRPNITFDPGPANETVVIEVQVAPDGRIIGRKVTKPSGNPAWDQAMLRAIDKTEMLPRDPNSPPSFSIQWSTRDLQ